MRWGLIDVHTVHSAQPIYTLSHAIASSGKVKKLRIGKCRQNWRTKRFQRNPHNTCVWNAVKNRITLSLRLANEVWSSYRVNRQTDTQNDYRNPTAHAPRVNESHGEQIGIAYSTLTTTIQFYHQLWILFGIIITWVIMAHLDHCSGPYWKQLEIKQLLTLDFIVRDYQWH